MIFELVKLTGGLMMPLPVVLILLVAGLVLVVAGRRRRLGIGFIAGGTVLLIAVSVPWLSERALRDLEQEYPVLREPPQAEWIVVLGGGSSGNEALPPASRLGESSMYRLAEGVRIAKLLPDARLVTSGGGSGDKGLSTAELMAKLAVDWGIEASRITTFTKTRNTEAEARAVKGARDKVQGSRDKVQGSRCKAQGEGSKDRRQKAEDRGRKAEDRGLRAEDRLILVTSAFHMRRAKVLFEGQGLEVFPAPAGHLVDPARDDKHIGYQLPQAKYIGFAETALWERIGLIWAWLRGAR